jgi:hypothetical protein
MNFIKSVKWIHIVLLAIALYMVAGFIYRIKDAIVMRLSCSDLAQQGCRYRGDLRFNPILNEYTLTQKDGTERDFKHGEVLIAHVDVKG